jgi:TolA-binding protein
VLPQPPGQDVQAEVGAAEAVRRLEAHVGDLRAQLGRLGEELETRRQEQAEERETHRREVQQLHTLLAQAQHLALPPPAAGAPAAASATAPADAPAAAEAAGEAVPPQAPPRLPWWRRLFSWDGAEASA